MGDPWVGGKRHRVLLLLLPSSSPVHAVLPLALPLLLLPFHGNGCCTTETQYGFHHSVFLLHHHFYSNQSVNIRVSSSIPNGGIASASRNLPIRSPLSFELFVYWLDFAIPILNGYCFSIALFMENQGGPCRCCIDKCKYERKNIRLEQQE